MPVAARWITGQETVGGAPNPNSLDPGNIGLAMFTLLAVLVMTKIPGLSRLSILLGLVVGTIAALIVGKTDFDGVADEDGCPEKDTDGDGAADVFKTHADGWGVSGDYHEYVFGSKLDANGEMVLDELVYDPGAQDGSLAVNMVQGVFTFVSGQIAKTDPDAMTITTPMNIAPMANTLNIIGGGMAGSEAAWQAANAGLNVVIHEFAHKIDMLDGIVDGTPPIAAGPDRERWITVCTELFGPVVTVYIYEDNDWAKTLKLVDGTSEYALTGAVLATDRYAIDQATKHPGI